MKKILTLITLCFVFLQSQAQKTVNIKGSINNFIPSELIYLGIDGVLTPLEISDDGTFTINKAVPQSPSFFYLSSISKRGKVERQTPQIWFDNEQIEFSIDWSNKSLEMDDFMPFQETSEKIEALSGKEQFKYILSNPNNIPSLFFADKQKESLSISDLQQLIEAIDETYTNSTYAKRIRSYIDAKKRNPLKKGRQFENFKLPNKDGEYVPVINSDDKTHVIALFTSGCPYSISSVDFVKELSELNNNKINIITIWEDSGRDTWLYAQKEEKSKITWTDLWDENGFAATYLDRSIWPSFYIVNSEGVLTQVLKGYDKKTRKELKKLVE